jgi:signal transduction histidine kinase
VDSGRSPTFRLVAGLAVTLSAVAVYAGFTIHKIRALRQLQTETIDRDRTDSLVLLRIQNDLNGLALAMRDMLDANEPYPLSAWRGQFKRIHSDLDDALAREEKLAPMGPTADQRRYFTGSLAQFWDALDRIFALADNGQEREAQAQIRLSLQARQSALSAAVSRLLIQNNENQQATAARAQEIYRGVERDVYIFLAAMLLLIAITSLYLVQYNRRMFEQVAGLSQHRSELAQQLISTQESAFRSISRELHDEFGQILTAIGAMLQRAARSGGAMPDSTRSGLNEIREIVQAALEKVRSLSQALHPVILDEVGLEGALDAYLPGFEKQTGIEIRYEKSGPGREVDRAVSIHLYRVVQEALNNVARHSKSPRAAVRLRYAPQTIVLEVEDGGIGFRSPANKLGMGLVSMRERAGLVNGHIEFLDGEGGGALVRLTAPLAAEEAHAGA